MLKTMPSIQTRTDVIGATENRPIHPCEACQSGKTSATARQITNRTTSAAESPHPSATMLKGLFCVVCVFIASLLLQPTKLLATKSWCRQHRAAETKRALLPHSDRSLCQIPLGPRVPLGWLVAHTSTPARGTSQASAASATAGESRASPG